MILGFTKKSKSLRQLSVRVADCKGDLYGEMKEVYIVENANSATKALSPCIPRKARYQCIAMNVGGEMDGIR